MSSRLSPVTSLRHVALLRSELSQRNQDYARTRALPCALSRGGEPSVCYPSYSEGALHGNFHPASYAAILNDADWRKRLLKVHTQGRTALPPLETGRWRELDSSNSSDALLMNIFCFPGVAGSPAVTSLLAIEEISSESHPPLRPQFGYRARVPVGDGKFDRTEVDMRLGDLLVEAKLTESDFQCCGSQVLERYPAFRRTFDRSLLPRIRDRKAGDRYLSYQLVRNVLAALASGCSFCLFCDQRRPDLIEAWYLVLRAIKPLDLRLRCKLLTWQELAGVLPPELQVFLDEKYGISAN